MIHVTVHTIITVIGAAPVSDSAKKALAGSASLRDVRASSLFHFIILISSIFHSFSSSRLIIN